MKKLLIAESSPCVIDKMMQLFCDDWQILICRNNYEAVDAFLRMSPDAAIISQRKPDLDPHFILSECFPDLPVAVVVITPSAMNANVRKLARWGVDCVFEVPYDMKSLKRNLTLLYRTQGVRTSRAAQHLRVLGVNAGANGYFCLLLAVAYFGEDMSQQLHNDVYCRVAEVVGMDERSIEKAIRVTIQHAWRKRNPEMWAKYFPVDENSDIACPKNKEFIMSLAQRI